MKRLAIILLPILAACQHNDPGVHVVYQDKPVPMPCLPLEEIPAEPPRIHGMLNGDAEHDNVFLASRALALLEWGEGLHRALTACAAISTNEPPNVSSEQSGG